MTTQMCATCGASIENAAVSGIFCQTCFARDISPKPGWRAWLSGPLAAGGAIVLAAYCFSIRINEVDYASALGGILGILLGGIGLVLLMKAPSEERNKKLPAAGVILLLALLLVRSSNVLSFF